MDELQTKNAVKINFLWFFPVIYDVWYKILDTLPRETRVFEKGNELINCNKGIDLFIDIVAFFRAFHILYFFLYIIIVSVFKDTYKLITIVFLAFQIFSIVYIDYIYAQPQSIIALAYSMCYFTPFYFIVYVLTKKCD